MDIDNSNGKCSVLVSPDGKKEETGSGPEVFSMALSPKALTTPLMVLVPD